MFHYLRGLSSIHRHQRSDLALARYLTFVAGATNAGGFLATQIYTSHMSGLVATMADFLVLAKYEVVFTAIGAIVSFVLGAATTALMVNWARRSHLESRYALPLLLEALLLLLFALVGRRLAATSFEFVSSTVVLLGYLMGLQNALITKISSARIRTTHVTGMVTDIGIELGRLLYWNRASEKDSDNAAGERVVADLRNLKMLLGLVGLFFAGGLVGATGFSRFGFLFSIPLALLVAFVAVMPAWDDVSNWYRLRNK
jgi:uncharacterized membrane protein YoaK (UPF0700 family)